MKLRPVKWVLSPTDDHMLSMECTDIEIVDEGGGEYVEVSQSADGRVYRVMKDKEIVGIRTADAESAKVAA